MLDDGECFKNCPRVIRKDKYETQGLETYNWWLRLFQIMENEAKIPDHQRKDVIRKIFPDAIFNKIVSLMTLRSVSEEPGQQDGGSLRSKRSVTFSEEVGAVSAVEEEEEEEEEEKKVTHPTPPDTVTVGAKGRWKKLSSELKLGQRLKEKSVGRRNPYTKFFKTNVERVAIWHDLPPLKLEEMNLNQRAVFITESIAVDFVNWLLKLGGETPTTLDVEQIVKMFEIGFDIHAATSLQGFVRELPSVTRAVAVARQVPEQWTRMKLKDEIQKDIGELKKNKLTRAFGTNVPANMRYIPPTINHTKRWLEIKAPKELTSMSAVWEGITHLRATRAYCQWLISRPHLTAPKYLVDAGMLSPSYYLQRHYSVESLDSEKDVGIDVNAIFEAHMSAMYD